MDASDDCFDVASDIDIEAVVIYAPADDMGMKVN